MRKKGISPVIATVLLVLLTVVIVGILTYFVIPFATKNLSGSGDCFDLLNKITLEENMYTCYVPTVGVLPGRTGFSLRIDTEQPVDIKVLFYNVGRTTANSVTLRDQAAPIGTIGVKMFNVTGGFNQPISVPSRGSVRTYIVEGAFERIEVNPILKSGKVCNEQPSITLRPCTAPNVISALNG